MSCCKVLPSQVVRELDGLKQGTSDTARAARRVIGFLRNAQRSKVGWLVGAPDLPMMPELTVGSGMTADRVILVSTAVSKVVSLRFILCIYEPHGDCLQGHTNT